MRGLLVDVMLTTMLCIDSTMLIVVSVPTFYCLVLVMMLLLVTCLNLHMLPIVTVTWLLIFGQRVSGMMLHVGVISVGLAGGRSSVTPPVRRLRPFIVMDSAIRVRSRRSLGDFRAEVIIEVMCVRSIPLLRLRHPLMFVVFSIRPKLLRRSWLLLTDGLWLQCLTIRVLALLKVLTLAVQGMSFTVCLTCVMHLLPKITLAHGCDLGPRTRAEGQLRRYRV